MRETAGIIHTAGFVCTRTRYGYGVRGYGCGLGNLYPRYTRAEPYLQLIHFRVHKPALMMAATPFGLLTRRNNAFVGTAKIGLI